MPSRSVGDSPQQTATNRLVPPHWPHPCLEETKSSPLRLYASSHLKSKRNWGNNKGFINSIISNRKYWIGAYYNFFPYFGKYYVRLKKKKKRKTKIDVLAFPRDICLDFKVCFWEKSTKSRRDLIWLNITARIFKLHTINTLMGQERQKV